MPELANKTLEDIDEMFEAGVPAWRTRRKYILFLLEHWPFYLTGEKKNEANS